MKNKMVNLAVSFILVVLGYSSSTECALRFANSFGDYMVLQRAPKSAHIYGFADVVGDTLVVRKNGVDVGQTTVVANPNNALQGVWKFKLPPESSHGPFTINVTSSKEGSVAIKDVMFGDVWLCSGQSNMQFMMAQVNNSAAEINDALKYPDIRMLYTKLTPASNPSDDVILQRAWVQPKKGSIEQFSAVCFLFARDLQKRLNYPIGLIESNWGGTPIELWSSPDALAQCPGYAPQKWWAAAPSGLWNSMIYPYLQTTIKGAIWYQGEANSGLPDLYACQFPAMISDWRQKFFTGTDGETDDNFPFGFVQLAPNANTQVVGGFPATRWAQTANVGYVPNSKMPNTFMAVAADLPDFTSPSGSIHPRYKQDVAARLALGALNVAYGDSHVIYQGPFPTSYALVNSELEIMFDNGTADIYLKGIKGFQICCATSETSDCKREATWVDTYILSTQKSSVHITISVCPTGSVPAGVRYIWAESPCALKACPLYGKPNDLPLPPFIKTGGLGFNTSSFAGLGTKGALRFANSFGDHMVLQRAPQSAHIYGFAGVVGDTLVVRKNGVDVGQTTVVANPNNATPGVWKFKLPPESNHGPYTINVTSSKEGSIAINDVMFGDVWICSGQSNMQFKMSEVNNSAVEINDALNYPDIRMLFSKLTPASTPSDDVILERAWVHPMKGFIENFSALCFLFGRDLQKRLNYPIGLIESNWGGTPIEVWSSPDAIAQCDAHGVKPSPSKWWPSDPSALWNSMIYPYLQTTIKGAIWYQGESNAGHPDLYACQFPAMISDWRHKFFTGTDGETDQNFPFGFVQLAAYRNNQAAVGGFPPLRWAQTANVGYVPNDKMPNTFMAVAVDLPDFTSPSGAIHPRYKQDIAARLALGALNVAYGDGHVIYQGPFPTSYALVNSELEVIFDNGDATLYLKDTKGFQICCAASKTSNCSSQTTWVDAHILSTQKSSVHIGIPACPSGSVPAGIRYIWAESPCALKACPLYGKPNDLPVPPFIKTGGLESESMSIIG